MSAPDGMPLSVHPADGGRPLSFAHHAMACTWGIHILDQPRDYAEQAAQAAFAEIDRLEQELSRFVECSDVSRINRLRAGRTERVGADAFDCLRMAAELHRETGGAFDATLGACVDARRDGAGGGDDDTDAAVAAGMSHLSLDAKTRSVGVDTDGLVVDLGGIGKGYAVDRAVESLREWSIAAALVHSGQSTLFALGRPAGAPGWTIGVRDPSDHTRTLAHVRLQNFAMSGSGIALHGRHIIDPRRGQTPCGRSGAWCCAPSAAISDALSTTFMILSRAEVQEYCRSHSSVVAGLADESQLGALPQWLGAHRRVSILSPHD